MAEKLSIKARKRTRIKFAADTQSNIELSQAVLDAARILEDSYDKKAANQATEQARKAALGHDTGPQHIDYSKFYRKTLWEACQEANPAFAQFVYLLLTGTWNDALDHANEIINGVNGEADADSGKDA